MQSQHLHSMPRPMEVSMPYAISPLCLPVQPDLRKLWTCTPRSLCSSIIRGSCHSLCMFCPALTSQRHHFALVGVKFHMPFPGPLSKLISNLLYHSTTSSLFTTPPMLVSFTNILIVLLHSQRMWHPSWFLTQATYILIQITIHNNQQWTKHQSLWNITGRRPPIWKNQSSYYYTTIGLLTLDPAGPAY